MMKEIKTGSFRLTVINYGIMFIEKFESDNDTYMQMLISCGTVRQMMAWVYCCLVADKKLLPLDKVEIVFKQRLWQEVKNIACGKLNNDQCICLSKALYVLKNL